MKKIIIILTALATVFVLTVNAFALEGQPNVQLQPPTRAYPQEFSEQTEAFPSVGYEIAHNSYPYSYYEGRTVTLNYVVGLIIRTTTQQQQNAVNSWRNGVPSDQSVFLYTAPMEYFKGDYIYKNSHTQDLEQVRLDIEPFGTLSKVYLANPANPWLGFGNNSDSHGGVLLSNKNAYGGNYFFLVGTCSVKQPLNAFANDFVRANIADGNNIAIANASTSSRYFAPYVTIQGNDGFSGVQCFTTILGVSADGVGFYSSQGTYQALNRVDWNALNLLAGQNNTIIDNTFVAGYEDEISYTFQNVFGGDEERVTFKPKTKSDGSISPYHSLSQLGTNNYQSLGGAITTSIKIQPTALYTQNTITANTSLYRWTGAEWNVHGYNPNYNTATDFYNFDNIRNACRECVFGFCWRELNRFYPDQFSFATGFDFVTLRRDGGTGVSSSYTTDGDADIADFYREPSAWYDIPTHLFNFLVWIALEAPLISNLTRPLMQITQLSFETYVTTISPILTGAGLLGVLASALLVIKLLKGIVND